MNKFSLPPCPNWTGSNIATLSSDGTLIYGARNINIVLLKESNDPKQAADVKVILGAHKDRISAVAIDHRNWNKGTNQLIASAGFDNFVKVWDAKTLYLKQVNSAHQNGKGQCVAVNFVDDKVISITDNGDMCVWNVVSNTFRTSNSFVGKRLNCMITNEKNSSITVVGSANGFVYVCNTKDKIEVIHKFKPSNNEIISLSFCPNSQIIIPQFNNDSKSSSQKLAKVTAEPKKVEKEVITKANAWNNLKFPDDDEIPDDSSERYKEMIARFNDSSDFLEECTKLKDDLQKLNDSSDEEESSPVSSKRKNGLDDTVIENVPENETDATTYDFLDTSGESVEELENENGVVELEVKPCVDPNSLLIAVGIKGGNFCVWQVDNKIIRCQKTFQLQSKKKDFKSRSFQDNLRTDIHWALPNIILLSTTGGHLYVWDVTGESNSGRLIHSDHKNKTIYAILTQPYNEDLNFSDLKAWTIGFDRSIMCTSLSVNRTCLNYYPTFNGYVYDISASPLDPHRLAFAGGDQTLRTLDLSKQHTNIIHVNSLNSQIYDKILTVKWHPTLESALAFGCNDGRVGVVDPTNPSKMVFLKHYTNKPVYAICWAPKPSAADKFDLYVAINGECIIYENKNKTTEPKLLNLETEESFKCNDISWKPDYSILALGGRDGSVVFSSPEYNILSTTYDLKKPIQGMAWHSPMVADEEEESKYSNYFAVAANDTVVFVYDCSEVLSGSRPEVVAKLEGHTAAVNTIGWSPHTNGLLLSGSADGTVRVWNVLSQTLVSIFSLQSTKVLTSMWSPFDPDLILTGTNDSMLRIWKISENPPVLEKETKRINVLNAAREKLDQNNEDSTEHVSKATAAQIVPNKQKSLILESLAQYQNKPGDVACDVLNRLINYVEGNGEGDIDPMLSDVSDPVKIFGTQQHVTELIEIEESNLTQNEPSPGKIEQSENLALWKGNMKEIISKHIEKKTLKPIHLSFAPMLSHGFWKETVVAYAEQQLDQKNYIVASNHFLVLNETEKAINALVEGKHFREALVLTKLHLSENDPLVPIILEKWAKTSVEFGAFEIAAQCFIALKKYGDAAKLLSRRNEMPFLKIALKLATKADNADLVKSIELAIDTLTETKVELELPPLPTAEEIALKNCKISDVQVVEGECEELNNLVDQLDLNKPEEE